jgi:hypothetical protein
MATYFKSNRYSLCVPFVAFMVIACNNKTEEKSAEKKDTTDTTSRSQTTQAKSTSAGTTLDILYMDATSFKNLPTGKRVFFILTYINPDIVTLSGWATTPSGSFNDPPIVLNKSGSIIINEDTVYVGNVKLDPNDVQNVKNDINSTGAINVLFTPSLSPTYTHHIQYTISLTKDDPAKTKNPAIIPTTGTVIANPSPPKQL